MKLKQKLGLSRAGLILALALSLLSAATPISRAAEPPRHEAAYGASTAADARQLDPASVRPADPADIAPTPGVSSPQSVGPPGSSGSVPRPPTAPAQTGGSLQPSDASAMSAGVPRHDDAMATERAPNGKPARAGSLIVTFRRGIQASAQTDAHRQAHAQAQEPVGRRGAVRVQVAPGTLAAALAAYAARPDVERVEPDYAVYASMTPNDPKYGEAWGLPTIQAPAAWDRVGGAAGVRVAILDTGIASHPDLAGRVILAADFVNSPSGPTDRHGHGTHVAGTIGAIANNGVGLVGVAWNASLLNAKVLADGGAGSLSSVANGIVWAADNGAQVINMSLGADLECTSVLQDAIDHAWSKGAVIVAAAGNSGREDVHTPANCANVVPVGAVNASDARASFSNYGRGVAIAAPGEGIVSTGLAGDYTWMSGTSMATPHAAGVAALIWASSYGTSNQAVVNRLLSTADRVAGTGSHWVYGRINASAAVGGANPAPPPAPTPSPTPQPSPSPSPSPAPSPPPIVCTPRPPVSIQTARGVPGVLAVTITAGRSNQVENRLRQIRFGAGQNAVIEAGTRAEAGNFTITLPSAPGAYTFLVRRGAAGGSVTVPLTVVDTCGEWQTFVGGGPHAF